MEVGLGPGHRHIVLWGPTSQRRTAPNLGPCLLWACGQLNSWMDQDATRRMVGLGPGDIMYGEPATPSPKRHTPNFGWPGRRCTSMTSFILIHRAVWPQYSNVTAGQDRPHRSGSSEPFYKRSPKNCCATRAALFDFIMHQSCGPIN